MSISGLIKPIPNDLKWSEQLMRPIFLTQIIFAGYMCSTSIFYFMDVLGYINFQLPAVGYSVDTDQLELVATCQQYYCLGHAALVTGILSQMTYSAKQQYFINPASIPNFLLSLAIISLPVSLLFRLIPGLSQFSLQFIALSFISGTLALAFAIPLKKIGNTILCLFLYVSNFTQAFLSGFKEPIIISILVLGIFLYPFYKRIVFFVFLPILFLLFLLLPTYNRVFRENAWSDGENTSIASDAAVEALYNQTKTEENETNWDFLTGRLSEIGMFTTFVKSTPDRVDYYGLKIVKQSFLAIIPRIFWPAKPITEEQVMERVYDAGVVETGSKVSAKPAVVVDAYLSGGTLGVLITFLIYGAAAQFISSKAEKLFGGYVVGTALIYSGLFQSFWRGLTFEFMLNTIFWGYISMLIIFRVLKATHFLKEFK